MIRRPPRSTRTDTLFPTRRSSDLVAPFLLLLTTVISFGATLGIAALLFNHIWGFPGADPSVIIYGFVFLVALGIDYNRSEEHTSELQSLMRISYAVFCLNKKHNTTNNYTQISQQ